MLSLARLGNAVFIGRGADMFLPRDVGLRIRIVAPLELRLARLGEQLSRPVEQVREQLAELEQERATFIRKHFGVEIDDPARYDLAVNRARLSAEQTAELILCARKLRNRA